MKLFDKTFDVIEKSMDLRSRRHTILSSNVMNSETPNFVARDLDFSGELEKALTGKIPNEISKTNSAHMDSLSRTGARPVIDDSGAMGADGNNVDLDIAMGKLSENSRAYTNATTWLGVQLRLLKSAARGRPA